MDWPTEAEGIEVVIALQPSEEHQLPEGAMSVILRTSATLGSLVELIHLSIPGRNKGRLRSTSFDNASVVLDRNEDGEFTSLEFLVNPNEAGLPELERLLDSTDDRLLQIAATTVKLWWRTFDLVAAAEGDPAKLSGPQGEGARRYRWEAWERRRGTTRRKAIASH